MTVIEMVDNTQKAQQLVDLLADVWGGERSIQMDVIVAVVHSGGYASLATQESDGKTRVVGGSLAFIGQPEKKLHSHVTGVVKDSTNSGIGSALKQHQWNWAKENDFVSITWTFDPLVRRNAHFNLISLGAKVISYHLDFYGELDDKFNAGDKTDRLYVERQVAGHITPPSSTPCIATNDDVLIATPSDIVALRQSSNPDSRAEMLRLRQTQRENFQSALADSRFVRGFTSDGSFVLSRNSGNEN